MPNSNQIPAVFCASVVDPAVLLGQQEPSLIELSELHCRVQPDVVTPLRNLAAAAARAGFDLQVASSYRSFDRQLHIWNTKAAGLRPVLDADGNSVDMAALTDAEKLFAILRWSALPGTSRHHWGCELDIYDRASIQPDYALQLTLAETQAGGPFAAFYRWLNTSNVLADGGFVRPYSQGLGSVAAEPWHLSYAPLANQYAQQLTEPLLRDCIERSDIALKSTVLAHLSEIFAGFVAPYKNLNQDGL